MRSGRGAQTFLGRRPRRLLTSLTLISNMSSALARDLHSLTFVHRETVLMKELRRFEAH